MINSGIGLINNAGITDGQLATKMDVVSMKRLIAINLTGPFLLAREVAKRLIRAKQPSMSSPGQGDNLYAMALFVSGLPS